MPRCLNDLASRWQDVKQAVINKEKDPLRYQQVFIGSVNEPVSTSVLGLEMDGGARLERKKKYYLDIDDSEMYFTEREGEVMYLIMHGHTNIEVGKKLDLSPRTIEYYIRNMRDKVGCRSKAHLIQTILSTQFLIKYDGPRFYDLRECL